MPASNQPCAATARGAKRSIGRHSPVSDAAAVARALHTDTHLLLETVPTTHAAPPWLLPVVTDALEGQGQVLIVTVSEIRRKMLETQIDALKDRLTDSLVVTRWRPRRDYLCLERLAHLRNRVGEPAPNAAEPHVSAAGDLPPKSPPDDAARLVNRRKGKRPSSVGPGRGQTGVPEMPGLSASERDQLEALAAWAEQTQSGVFDDRPDGISRALWRRCTTEEVGCIGSSCPLESDCFARRGFMKLPDATVIFCDYEALFACIEARRNGTYQWHLPPHLVIVLEEAHRVEELARHLLGLELSMKGIRVIVQALEELDAHAAAGRIWTEAVNLFAGIAAHETAPDRKMRPNTGLPVSGRPLLEVLEGAAAELKPGRKQAPPEAPPEAPRKEHTRRQLLHFADGLFTVMGPDDEHIVSFDLDTQNTGVIRAPLLRVAEPMSSLFDAARAVIVTSDTLQVGPSFSFIRKSLGVPDSAKELVAAPRKGDTPKLLLVVPERIPEPSERDWPMAVSCRFIDVQNATNGRACAHFTSDAVIEHVQRHVRYLRARIRRDDLEGPALVDLLPAEASLVGTSPSQSQTGSDHCLIVDRLPFWHWSDCGAVDCQNMFL